MSAPAVAASKYWDGGRDNQSLGTAVAWASDSSWLGDVAPTTADDLIFQSARSSAGTAGYTTTTVASTLALNGSPEARSVLFDGSQNKVPLNLVINATNSGNFGRLLTLTGDANGSTTLLAMSGYSAAASVTFNSNATTGIISLVLGSSGIVSVAEATSTLNLNADISGNFGLAKTGAGELKIAGANTFTGAVKIDGGTLTLAGGSNTFSGVTVNNTATLAVASDAYLPTTVQTTINDGGTLRWTNAAAITSSSTSRTYALGPGTATIENAQDVTIAGAVSGNGTLKKTGAGRLILSKSNNGYSGGTMVTGGTVVASNTASLGSGATVVSGTSASAFGTLSGTGSTGGDVAVNNFGVITAGSGAAASDTVGTLTTGNQSWSAGGKYVWKTRTSNASLTAGTASTWDLLSMGTLTAANGFTVRAILANGTFTAPAASSGTTKYLLARTTNTTDIDVESLFVLDTSALGVPASVGTFSLSFEQVSGGYNLNLNYQPAPEPTTVASVGLGASVLLGRRRRKLGERSIGCGFARTGKHA